MDTQTKPKRISKSYQVSGDHYLQLGVQPWDVINSWPLDQQIGFHRGNALKYLLRMGTKDPSVDELKKAVHYLEKLIEVLTPVPEKKQAKHSSQSIISSDVPIV